MGFRDVGEAYLLSQEPEIGSVPWPTALDMAVAVSKLASWTAQKPLAHGLEMGVLAHLMAENLGWEARRVRAVMQAALLHDAGFLPVSGRFSVEAENQVGTHTRHIWENPSYSLQGLSRHLNFPLPLVRWLHLNDTITEWVGCHHTYLNGMGLLPESHYRVRPGIEANLIALVDIALDMMGGSRNRATRLENLRVWRTACPPDRFYPELLAALDAVISIPEALAVLDHRGVQEAFMTRYPEQETSPQLNGMEVLQLCRWLGEQADLRHGPDAKGECTETADLLVAMGKILKLPMAALGQLAIAGYLHDIGKLGLPLSVLQGDRLLDPLQDQPRLEKHVTVPEAILSDLPGFSEIAEWVGAHHEQLNGEGYPYRRRRHEISIGARLLAIADSYVALRRSRPYRPAYRAEDALEVLEKNQGRIYDTSLIGVLKSTLRFNSQSGSVIKS